MKNLIHKLKVGGGAAPLYQVEWSGPFRDFCDRCTEDHGRPQVRQVRYVEITDLDDDYGMAPPVWVGALCADHLKRESLGIDHEVWAKVH